MDPARIGVFGWSYGGYMALMCMMQAPDEFAAGVSGAPVTDWRLYDTHYTERYMGTPADNAAGYDAGDVLTYAEKLAARCWSCTAWPTTTCCSRTARRCSRSLQDLNKPFDVMTYPGSKHGLLRFAGTGPHGYATIVRFFDRTLRGSEH